MLRLGHFIALAVIALLTLGVVMVNSAGMSVAPIGAEGWTEEGVTPESILLSRSTVYMLLALAALIAGSILPVRSFAERFARPEPMTRGDWKPDAMVLCAGGMALVAVMAMVYLPGVGKSVNGAQRWIAVPGMGGFSFQPSEIAKWGMCLLVAWYGARRTTSLGSFITGLAPALAVTGLVAGFIIIEDLGTGVLVGAVACLVLIAAGAKLWHFMAMVPLAAMGLLAAIATSPYRVKRIMTFINPYEDPQGAGYHMIQSMTAVAGGGGFGRGLGHGLQKFGYLPEDQTDFLFAIICEELGIAGAAIVIGLFIVLTLTGMAIAVKEREPMLKLLALSVTATVGLQAIINLFVVTGLGPTKGIALPLVSSGGTGWILTAFSLGLLVSINRGQEDPDADGYPSAATA
ncbi:MAG: FtsW/RodA/SpoVE family cell cycle protein [Phycisphaeraceae bacterium]|nr:FtsW/RodA/SpoVE family cell cycle protein [Phycisphaeraceae bacterium]MBX3366561.1 FtsW/RodA/SpoVE family cell cycle protein [Phycisphaeraceae bacterium]